MKQIYLIDKDVVKAIVNKWLVEYFGEDADECWGYGDMDPEDSLCLFLARALQKMPQYETPPTMEEVEAEDFIIPEVIDQFLWQTTYEWDRNYYVPDLADQIEELSRSDLGGHDPYQVADILRDAAKDDKNIFHLFFQDYRSGEEYAWEYQYDHGPVDYDADMMGDFGRMIVRECY